MTDAPLQTVVEAVEIDTVGVTGVTTLMVMVLLVAICPETQGELLVMTQFTVLPSIGLVILNDELLVPTGAPFKYH